MKVAIMGYGTIGSGVAEVLDTNKDALTERVGEPLELKYILDLRDFPGDPHEDCLVKEYQTIVNDAEVSLVVETMGGVEPAFTFVKAMLEAGKSVTTSNKALVADKGAELIAIAQQHNVNFIFEAAVGGGIPIIRVLRACLTGDVIEDMAGIVNGTTNYMLTKMEKEGCEYEDVLKEAQAKGYAEKDPTADVEGYDACRKIAILTSLVAGKQVNYGKIPTEGISKLTAVDFKYAKKLNRSIKLLATSKRVDNTYSCRVAPYLLDESHTLYHVQDVYNAVYVRGNMLGDSMYYGAGAGKLPTASAVVADLVFLARNSKKYVPLEWKSVELELADSDKLSYRYFVRTKNSKSDVDKLFASVEYIDIDIDNEVGFVTEMMTEADFKLKSVKLNGILNYIRLA